MKKLSAEKKKHMMIVGGVTLVVLALMYMFVVTAQQMSLLDEDAKITEAKGKLYDAETKIKMKASSQAVFDEDRQKLIKEEEKMAPPARNEWKLWMRTQLTNVQTNKHHDVILQEITMEPNYEVGAELLPKFPFAAARFKVPIVAHYPDLGKFIADVENRYPYMRVENLTIQPYVTLAQPSEMGGAKSEKLLATMHMVSLIKAGGL